MSRKPFEDYSALFYVPIIGQGIIWGTCDRALAWKKFFSDSASNLVTMLLTALMASCFV